MISKIVNPRVVGLFDINLSQAPCLINNPLSRLDPYTPPNDYQIFHATAKPS